MSSALDRATGPDPQQRHWDAPAYPPADHFLRDLGMTVELHPDGTARGSIPISSDAVTGGGWPRAGIVGVLVDSVAGAVAVMSARPERVATADMTLQLVRPVHRAVAGELAVEAAVTRRGRTTVVIEATVLEDTEAPPVGWATLTFALLPARAHQLGPGEQLRPDEVVRTDFGAGGVRRSVLDRVGFGAGAGAGRDRGDPPPPGEGALNDVVELDVGDYVRNTFGAVQGGIVTLVVDEAARRVAPGAVVVDLHLAFLAPCKEGPIVGRAAALHAPGTGPGAALVELRDTGAGDRVTTLADAGLIVDPHGAR